MTRKHFKLYILEKEEMVIMGHFFYKLYQEMPLQRHR